MPDLSEAELAELEWRSEKLLGVYQNIFVINEDQAHAAYSALPRLLAEVRRLRAENAELRKRSDPTDFDELHRKLGIKPFDEHDMHDLTDDM